MSAPTLHGYDVLGPLGSGGSAEVWRARRRFDNLFVALKVLRPEHGDLDLALAEAGLLAGIRHPHVIHLYDVLPLAGEQGRPDGVVLVTQLAAGGSLAQVLARRHLLVPGEVVTVLHPVCTTLADLHRAGVVHGDLSTGNILFRADGMPLLADLGAAKVLGEDGLRGLGTGAHDGMVAPEVVEGFPATAASDVYQVGALAWLALVGACPGPGFDRPPLAEVAPDLSPMVLDLITRCMEPEPEDRPDAQEVGAALMELATPEPVEVAPDADISHGVTQRLRRAALADEAASDPTRPGWWHGWGRGARLRRRSQAESSSGERRAGAHRHRRGTPTQGQRQEERQESGTNPGHSARPPLLVSGLVGLITVALAAMLGTALWPMLTPASTPVAPPGESAVVGAARPRPTLPAPADIGVSGPRTSSAATADAAARAPFTAPDLQRLLDLRGAAWEASDPALLGHVLLPGSSAEASEVAALEQAERAGISYPEVAFRVESFDVIDTDDRRVVVQARVWSGPVQAYAGGEMVLSIPEQQDEVRIELGAGDGGWRLRSWQELAAS